MSTPRDELFTSNREERAWESGRRTRLGCCGTGLLLIAAVIAVAWFLAGCAHVDRESPLAREIRQRWLAQKVRDLREAQEGVVFAATPER